MRIIELFSSSTLLKTTGIYTIANVVNASIPFLLIPLLTRYLSTEDYGMVAMFTLLVNFVSPFVGLSIHGAISRQYFNESGGDFPQYVGNCFFLLAGSTVTVSLIFLIFSQEISKYSGIPSIWLPAVLLISFSQFITLVLLTIWQVKLKPLNFGAFQISQTTLNFSLSLFFIVGMKRGWEGRVEGQLIAICTFSVLALFILWKNKLVKFSLNLTYVRHALSFSLPLIPHATGGLLINMTNRLFITNMEGLEKTGVFMVAFQIGNVISLLITSFNSAYVPWLYSKLNTNKQQTKDKIVRLTYIIFALFITIPLISYWVLPWFTFFFVSSEYVGVTGYAIWLIIGYCFNGMYVMVVNFIFYAQKTHLLAIITFSTAIVNIPVCFFLVKWNGAIGAAQSTAIVHFMSFIFTWMLSAKVYSMPWFTLKRRIQNE